MNEPYEDVPGANRAGRALRARQFAAMQLAADHTGNKVLHADLILDYARAGFTPAEIFAEAKQLRDLYKFDDRDPAESLEELRRMVNPYIDDGPQLRVDFHSDGETPL
ncbi:MAG: hypothetical protein WBB00_07430 [Mycobacterium sp.]